MHHFHIYSTFFRIQQFYLFIYFFNSDGLDELHIFLKIIIDINIINNQ